MPEYIEREALIDRRTYLWDGALGPTACVTVEDIMDATAVDAVEVVRCKDCKHYMSEQEPCHGRMERYCRLHKGLVVVGRETFCSYGERRADNATD